MNYVKKMCILRQIKQGFSGDGKALSGLIKIEQYGKNLAVEVSIINFAPLSLGEYYCLLSDGKGKTEMLALRGKSFFNILSDLDVTNGFCGIVCYVYKEITPIAYGINGNGSYDWKRILNAALPPVFPSFAQDTSYNAAPHIDFSPSSNEGLDRAHPNHAPTGSVPQSNEEQTDEKPQDLPEPESEIPPPPLPNTAEQGSPYDDETVAAENYYEENEREQIQLGQTDKNASPESANQGQAGAQGTGAQAHADAARVLHPFALDTDGYYLSVKREVDALFEKYPRDFTLKDAFSCSDWVRIKGASASPEYLVGVVYNDGKVRYICYAIRAKEGSAPPDEIKNVCSFVPYSPFCDKEGFFVIFQSAATGECLKPVC